MNNGETALLRSRSPAALIRSAAGALVCAILLAFTVRRWLFLLAALRPEPDPPPPPPEWPDVLLLVPVRNEAAALPGLLQALNRLEYPAHRLTVVIVDDGSTDSTAAQVFEWLAGRSRRKLLALPENVGKAAALNAALARFPQGQWVVVFDADERPEPDSLARLACYFSNSAVGGVSGRRAVRNGTSSPAAGYTALEGLVHQMITQRAKDRLNLAPALLGANCAYRRAALVQAGGFKPGALLEDSDLTVRLARAGWRTRFAPDAVSWHDAPQTVAGYWQQHTRWARGFSDVAAAQSGPLLRQSRLPPGLRLELLFFSLGYLDRLALAAGVALALLKHRWTARVVAFTLLTPLVQTVTALRLANQPPEMWRQMRWLPPFFALDVVMAATGLWRALQNHPRHWENRAERS